MSTPITAALVKELRDRTGAGMGDCKKALEATGGDLDKAAEKLRIDGMAKADKKGARTAAEGIIAVASSDSAVALVEVNCETDFVAKGDDFKALGEAAAKLALANKPATLEALLALTEGGKTLEEKRREFVAKAGENTTIRRFEVVEKSGGAIATYLHGSRIGVVVALSAGDEELAKDIAMHVAASSPRYLDAAAVPAESLESERKIIEAKIARDDEEAVANGKQATKPEFLPKKVEGNLRKVLEEVTLLGQKFVKDDSVTVEKLLQSKKAGVARFVRLAVGEGIEKKQVDFAAEVAAASQV
ncbi:translation elongation factor Ts [Hydrocarboniphaga effusa]|uniref:translation elongation factor Ts n=1 Tax=Hydrocarboniphaga effusa TaxID=243629 RepID=UPI003137C623